MPTISRDQVVSALARSLREAVAEGRTVDIPGLGRLRVRHERSRLLQDESGSMVLTPPKDSLVFEPEE